MKTRDVIVVGASAGGVEALTRLVGLLPADLPAAVFVVVHVPSHVTSLLPKIFSRHGALPASHPRDGESIQNGHIYVAPPDHHLLVKEGHIRLAQGPRENGHRPAVDPLFRTAALEYGVRVIGVVLSGSLDDGAAGLAAIKSRGGLAIVQLPGEALYPSMPRNAIQSVDVDHVLPIAEIAALLSARAGEPVSESESFDEGQAPDELRKEAEIGELTVRSLEQFPHPGNPSGFGCPDCGGALWELNEGGMLRFRCRIGHAWSAGSLLAGQADMMDSALWTALRALEERASLASRLAARMKATGSHRSAAHFEVREAEARRSAEIVRQLLLNGRSSLGDDPEALDELETAVAIDMDQVEEIAPDG